MNKYGIGDPASVGILGPATFDKFSIGILLAYLHYTGIKIPAPKLLFLLFMSGFVLISLIENYIPGKTYLQLELMSMAFFFLIHLAVLGIGGFPGKLLTCKPVIYIGRISYGLYLYHSFVPYLRAWFAVKIGLPALPSEINHLLNFGFLLLIASLSFRFIETPFNNLKNRFNYKES